MSIPERGSYIYSFSLNWLMRSYLLFTICFSSLSAGCDAYSVSYYTTISIVAWIFYEYLSNLLTTATTAIAYFAEELTIYSLRFVNESGNTVLPIFGFFSCLFYYARRLVNVLISYSILLFSTNYVILYVGKK